MEPIEIPIDGVLDLHTFAPRELSDLLQDYLEACRCKGLLRSVSFTAKARGF